MKRITIYMTFIAALLVCFSCQRRPLYEFQGGNLFINIDVQIAPEVMTQIEQMPELFAVAFYDAETHTIVKTDYVPAEGGYVQIEPGTYDILIYNFNTEYVQVRNQHNYNAVEAFTSNITGTVANRYTRVLDFISANKPATRTYASYPLIYEPDHLFVHTEELFEVPNAISENDVKTIYEKLTTLNEKFTITVRTINNSEYFAAAEAYLAGMGSAKRLADNSISGGPATMWCPLYLTEDGKELFVSFNAFGSYYPDDGNTATLIVRIIDKAGNEYNGEWDVTDQLKNGGHDIVINHSIDFNPVENETGAPTVNLWDEIVTEVEIK